MKSFTDCEAVDDAEEELEVQRLNEDSEGLIRWPNTLGYVYTSSGLPLSEDATRRAYDIFNTIMDEARMYYGDKAKTKTRMMTFYNSRMRKALEAIRKETETRQETANQVERILSGRRVNMGERESNM